MFHLVESRPTSGDSVAGLWRPSFTRDRHLLYTIGGGGVVPEHVQQLDLRTGIWTSLQTKGGTPPTKRYGHTAVLWRGINERQEFCGDVLLFGLNDHIWYQPTIHGHHAAPRYLHTALVYKNKMYVYGGFSKNTTSGLTCVLAQMNVLDLSTFTWQKPYIVPPRYNHSALLVHDQMYIYAGKNGGGHTVIDMYVVDLCSNKIRPQDSITGQIEPLKSHHFMESVGDNRVVMFGKFLKTPQKLEYTVCLLDLNTSKWHKFPKERSLEQGVWNYFTTATAEELGDNLLDVDDPHQRHLVFLGNTDPDRPPLYDHFRDMLVVSLKPTSVWQVPRETIQYDFDQLFKLPDVADFTLKPADGKPIGVHRAILYARWSHFRNMYNSGMKEATCDWMELLEPHSVVLAFTRYIYTDKLAENMSTEEVIGVLSMANMYFVPRLTKLCCRRLAKKHLSPTTAVAIFQAALLNQEAGLKLVALEYIFRNFGRIWHSRGLEQLNEEGMEELDRCIPMYAELVVKKKEVSSAPTILPATVESEHSIDPAATLATQNTSNTTDMVAMLITAVATALSTQDQQQSQQELLPLQPTILQQQIQQNLQQLVQQQQQQQQQPQEQLQGLLQQSLQALQQRQLQHIQTLLQQNQQQQQQPGQRNQQQQRQRQRRQQLQQQQQQQNTNLLAPPFINDLYRSMNDSPILIQHEISRIGNSEHEDDSVEYDEETVTNTYEEEIEADTSTN
ncbi:hypothetical protein BDF19DRAFT_419758 [Syncephalis fuscata]|nr:hypothetical protein BDF19DRAFT_419758 [Syncephalis fuscata]